MRFTFGFPHNGYLSIPFHGSVINMMMAEVTKDTSECLLGSTIESGSCHVPFNRNEIVKFFLEKTSDDFLLMIDTDIAFERDILVKLANHITNEGKDSPYWNREFYPHIIAGRVNIGNGLPVFYKRMAPGEYLQDPRPFTGLKVFDQAGTGIICISRYCLTVINREANTFHFFTHALEAGKLMSDDFSFMKLAEAHGFKPFGAWDIVGQHHKNVPIRSMYPETVEEVEKFKAEGREIPKWLTAEYFTPKKQGEEKKEGNNG